MATEDPCCSKSRACTTDIPKVQALSPNDCSDTKEKWCKNKNEKKKVEPKEEKSQAPCCSDTKEKCCDKKKKIEGDSIKVQPKEEWSQAPCCSDMKEKCCDKKKKGEGDSIKVEPKQEKSQAPCCSDTKEKSCDNKKKREGDSIKVDPKEKKSQAPCCSDMKEKCCDKKKKGKGDSIKVDPKDEKSQAPCCSDTKEKSCDKKKKGEGDSIKVEPKQEKSQVPCCSDTKEKSCDNKKKREGDSIKVDPKEEKSQAPCCSDMKEKCCDKKKKGEGDSIKVDPKEEKSQAPCCSDTKEKCCDKKKKREGDSIKVELKEVTSEAPCCSDRKEKCCDKRKKREGDFAQGEPKEERSQAPCYSETKDKCCDKKKKGEGGSPRVQVAEDISQAPCCKKVKDKCRDKKDEGEDVTSCCKETEGKVFLPDAIQEQPAVPQSSSTVSKPKETLPRKQVTKLRVQNICCGLEAQLVQECLKPLKGVENVAINVIGRVALVRHDPNLTSPTELVESLNQVHLGASVMEMGVHHDKDHDEIPWLLKVSFIYVVLQTFLFVSAVAGFFLEQPWYMWVAITEIIFGGAPILKRSYYAVRKGKIDINILMIIAIVGTMALGKWVEGATVVYAFAFAHALQEFCMCRVQRTISKLMLKRPDIAVLVETGESVPIESVDIGSLIAVRPGELIPLDGVVVKGKAVVDESSITGESIPVEKTVSSEVYSGTVSQNGYIEVETTSDSSTSTVWKITQLVQGAQSSSTKIEAIINRFAKYYTPLVVLIAALVVIVPAILGAAGVGNYLEEIREWGRRALVMLIIACPCALVMSTPIAVVCSITAAARKGALVKGGEHLETLSKIEVLAFDKTGTLTEGKFQVMNMECAVGENERDVLRLAAGLESKSVHPISAAIVNKFSGCVTEMVRNQIITLPKVTHFKMYEGQGISGMIEGKLVRVGNKEMADQCGASLTEAMADKYKLWSSESKTVVFVCVDEKLSLMIALADSIRHTATTSLDSLRDIGIQTFMITGDNSWTAEAVRSNLGLDECVSEMKPHEKLEWVQQKQNSKMALPSIVQGNKKWQWARDLQVMVGMVGDGVNDGPALAAANVGIAMGAGGTALAVEAADVALMSNDLEKIPELICLAKFCSRIVKQNIFLSVILKIATVIVALCGYLDLWMAVVGDVMGLLFVIINGLRPMMWKASKNHTKGGVDIEANWKKYPKFSSLRKGIKIPIPSLKKTKESWKIDFPQYGSAKRARLSSIP